MERGRAIFVRRSGVYARLGRVLPATVQAMRS